MINKLVSLLLITQLLGINLSLGHKPDTIIQTHANAASLYDDDFNSPQLDPKWHWVREIPTHWSLTANPGYLRIITEPKDIWQQTNTAPLLLQAAPSDNYIIETKVYITPLYQHQQGGLVIYGNDDNYVRLTYGFFNWIGIEFGKEISGNFQSIVIDVPSRASYYLRIMKIGKSFSGYYSEDGNNWVLVVLHSGVNLTPSYIGLLAFHSPGGASETPADFDYFKVRELIFQFLPIISH